MRKWELFKNVFNLLFVVWMFSIVVVSIIEFFTAELIVDKIHYGFIITFILIFFCGGNNQNNNNRNLATN